MKEEKVEESIEKVETKEKKNFHPIWMYLVAFILTIVITNFFGVGIALTQLEKTYGDTINISELTIEEVLKNEEYKAVYTESITKTAVIVQCVLFTVLVLVLILTNLKKIKSDFKKWNKKRLLYVLLATIGMVLLNFLISGIFVHFNVEMNNQDALASGVDALLIPTVIYLVILAPIAEEMLFRYALGTIINNKYVFIVVSTLLFAVIHGVGIVTIIYALLGLILTLIYVKTDKNITASIFAHMLNNIVSAITLIL